MKKGLLKDALIKLAAGIVLLGVLLFLPAGTLAWPNGWMFMILLFVPMSVAGIVMYVKAPRLLQSRLKAKESENAQKGVIRLSGLMFIAAFVLAGLNYRWGWIRMPRWTVILGAVVFLSAYAVFGEVLRENEYLSRTIEVREGQKVVDTGLYGIVRHPMYSATVFLFLSMPLILGSPFSFAVMLLYLPLIARRIRNEEEVLERELEGYAEYKKRVTARVIPHIW